MSFLSTRCNDFHPPQTYYHYQGNNIDFSSIYKARYNNGIFEQIKYGENMKTAFPGIQ